LGFCGGESSLLFRPHGLIVLTLVILHRRNMRLRIDGGDQNHLNDQDEGDNANSPTVSLVDAGSKSRVVRFLIVRSVAQDESPRILLSSPTDRNPSDCV
jgi:hypothetical protein